MSAFRILVTAAVLSVSAGLPAFANASEGHLRPERTSSEFVRGMPGYPWCLHNYADDDIDCS
jgi:hypothetical protein